MADQAIDWDFPDVFIPGLGPERYIGIKGGRGSGKSQFVGGLIPIRMMQGKNALCIREVQSTTADSSKSMIEKQIIKHGLSAHFNVLDKEIRCIATGAKAIFRGMQSYNAANVKSLEDFDIAWWEEAQSASQRSLDLLMPTIRKPGSQLIFTWNSENPTDAVDKFFVGTRPENSVLIHANYDDNPWFWDTELVADMRRDREFDHDKYEHVWLGQYLSQASMQLIPRKIVEAARKREVYTDMSDLLVIGVDVARFGDDTSVIWARRGLDARMHPPIKLKKVDLMTLAGRVKETSDELTADMVFIDETGLGAGVVDRCRQLGMQNIIGVNFGSASDRIVQGQAKAANKRAEMWLTCRTALGSGLAIPDDDEIAGELTSPLYSYDANNLTLLEKKVDMKKRLGRSPDIADALVLTYAYPVTARAVMDAHQNMHEETYNPWGT